jgi:regulator of RNase E activity RraA
MVIAPGDIIMGDADGVLSVPQDAAEQTAAKAEEKRRAEERQMEQTLSGCLDRSWVDVRLNKAGCRLV